MGLAGIFVIKSWVMSVRAEEKKRPPEGPRSTTQVVLFTGTIALATLLFKDLGYPLMFFLLLLALLRILGVKSWVYSLSLSFLTATGAYFLFVLWLKIPLPKGWIGI